MKEFIWKGRIEPDMLLKYSKGELKPHEKKRIESILLESKEDWENYNRLKEAIDLLGIKRKPKNLTVQNVLKSLPSQKILYKLSIEITGKKAQIQDLDSGAKWIQEMLSLSTRGSSSGWISIEKEWAGNPMKVNLIPVFEEKGYLIEIQTKQEEGIICILMVNQEEWEVIRDLKKKNRFESIVPEDSIVELVFKKKGKHVFSIQIQIQKI